MLNIAEEICEEEMVVSDGEYITMLGVAEQSPDTLFHDIIDGKITQEYQNPSTYTRIRVYASGAWSKKKQISPVIVENEKIKVYPERIKIGVYCPISIMEKEYLIHRPQKGIIDLYEIIK